MTFRILPSLSSSVEKRHYRLRGVKTDSQHGEEVASGGGVLVRATLRIIRVGPSVRVLWVAILINSDCYSVHLHGLDWAGYRTSS